MSAHDEQVTLFTVEDDDIDFMAIERSLSKMRIANPVIRSIDGEEAWSKLLNQDIPYPFIMLLDLRLPKLSGLELLSKIRAHEELKDTVVFILTTSADEKDIVQSLSKNVAGYFVKDEVGPEFLNVISLLEGYWRIAHLPGSKHESEPSDFASR